MKAVIFGGTTEGRQLSLALAAEGIEVVVSVASDYGAEEQGMAEGITVVRGLKDEAGIRDLIRGAHVVIDATHPYALLVTENIRRAAEAEGIERLRLLRGESGLTGPALSEAGPRDGSRPSGGWEHPAEAGAQDDVRSSIGWERPSKMGASGLEGPEAGPGARDGSEPGIRIAADPEAAARLAGEIAGAGGRVLLTTGSKDLATYAEALDPESLYARVLPLVSSIRACEAAGIPHRNIIAIQGPFSEDLNRAVIEDYDIDVLVTKDSGRAGGFAEKIRACEACGIPAIVIPRPREEGLSMAEVVQTCIHKKEGMGEV